MQTDCDIGSGV